MVPFRLKKNPFDSFKLVNLEINRRALRESTHDTGICQLDSMASETVDAETLSNQETYLSLDVVAGAESLLQFKQSKSSQPQVSRAKRHGSSDASDDSDLINCQLLSTNGVDNLVEMDQNNNFSLTTPPNSQSSSSSAGPRR